MGLLPDWMIERDVKIEPFAPQQHRPGVISYGVTSYGYDVRVGRSFKVFTNVYGSTVDPKKFDPKSFVDIEADECVIPPNSFALAETVEYFDVPRDMLVICLGKCLTGDTRVVDAATGDYLPLEEFIARKSGTTPALDGWTLRPSAVSDHIDSGVQEVYALRTRCGMTVKATASHPFLTPHGWMPLGSLREGERLAVARSCPVFGTTPLPEHEALLLGFMTADGQCRTPNSSPRYTTGDPKLAEVLTEAAEKFGVFVSPVGKFGYNLVNRRGRGGIVTPNKVYPWLQQHGIACLSIHKKVPPAVFRAPKESVAAFLRALFSGDGSVYTCTSKIGTVGVNLEYASSSERLALDVRHLLLRFGIFSLLRSKLSASGRTAYRVQVNDPEMVHLFAREIGFVPGSQKQQRLEEILADQPEERRRSNFDTLPSAFWPKFFKAAESVGKPLRRWGAVSEKQSIPLALARQVAADAGTAELQALANADVVWDSVESITPLGPQQVYDITVPGRHNFVANDVITHNSTYARCGIIVNVTPLEPEWRGRVTIEISNTTPLPAKIYANEGIAQMLFFRAEGVCRTSYADKKGKYQDQKGLTLPFVTGAPDASPVAPPPKAPKAPSPNKPKKK